jgi:hypothetical protein
MSLEIEKTAKNEKIIFLMTLMNLNTYCGVPSPSASLHETPLIKIPLNIDNHFRSQSASVSNHISHFINVAVTLGLSLLYQSQHLVVEDDPNNTVCVVWVSLAESNESNAPL